MLIHWLDLLLDLLVNKFDSEQYFVMVKEFMYLIRMTCPPTSLPHSTGIYHVSWSTKFFVIFHTYDDDFFTTDSIQSFFRIVIFNLVYYIVGTFP